MTNQNVCLATSPSLGYHSSVPQRSIVDYLHINEPHCCTERHVPPFMMNMGTPSCCSTVETNVYLSAAKNSESKKKKKSSAQLLWCGYGTCCSKDEHLHWE